MKLRSALLFGMLFVVGCGGGGGDDSNVLNNPDIPGRWDTNLELIENTCGGVPGAPSFAQTAAPTFDVNQDGAAVTAQEVESGEMFAGTIVESGTGFGVNGEPGFDGACATQSVLAFQDIQNGGADGVSYEAIYTCGGQSCQIQYVGNALRQ